MGKRKAGAGEVDGMPLHRPPPRDEQRAAWEWAASAAVAAAAGFREPKMLGRRGARPEFAERPSVGLSELHPPSLPPQSRPSLLK